MNSRVDALAAIVEQLQSAPVPVYIDQPDGPYVEIDPEQAGLMLRVRSNIDEAGQEDWDTGPLTDVWRKCLAFNNQAKQKAHEAGVMVIDSVGRLLWPKGAKARYSKVLTGPVYISLN